MNIGKIFREMRRRHMFRVAGFYIGIVWIVIQAMDILLPAFEAPEWIVRFFVLGAVGVFPFVMAMTWFYQLTEAGLKRDRDVRHEEIEQLVSGRTADFIVIGVLGVALSFSVYLNLQAPPAPPAEIQPVSLLIADIDNKTGDPLFDNALENALSIGLEGSPFIAMYRRDDARRIAADIDAGEKLDEVTARLVATREGIISLVTGGIAENGGKYEINIQLMDPRDGQIISEHRQTATSKSEVLNALSALTANVRNALGDQSADNSRPPEETFTTGSLEAMHEYTVAQELGVSGHDEEAMAHYKRAIEHDPKFGRAYSGLAVSEYKLGHTDDSEKTWQTTLSLLDGMTEREKYRTLGIYYSLVSRNHIKAIETYEELVKRFPADSAGHNNLAVAYFMVRDFDKALAEGRAVLRIYPKKLLYGANLALFAMYAGDFETAVKMSDIVIAADPSYHKAYLPKAIAAMVKQDHVAAAEAYAMMRAASVRGASLAAIGDADAAMYRGNYEEARTILEASIEVDRTNGDVRSVANKNIALAETRLALGDAKGALSAANASLEVRRTNAELVPASAIYLALDRDDLAIEIATELGSKLSHESRAYAQMINAQLALRKADNLVAIDGLQNASQLSEAWLIRLNLGIAYLQAGYFAEALSEFETCQKRHAEASAVFLNDVPTYRYLAIIPYWLGRAKEGLGMSTDAAKDYQRFLVLRESVPQNPLVIDVRLRLSKKTTP